MTPEQLEDEIRLLRYVVDHRMTGDDYPVPTKLIRWLLDIAERCADYDKRIGEAMPADFKDWHDNGPKEWPEVAADTIKRLRERLEQAERRLVPRHRTLRQE